MKTLLNITLAAFAVLSAGVANAQQCSNCAPPATPTAGPGSNPGCVGCGTSANNYITVAGAAAARATELNTSFVFQNGDRQYACVDQAGAGGNTADLIQDSRNDLADYGNNGYQNQINSGVGASSGYGKNVAWADQLGDRNVVVQKQNGSGNVATIHQGDWDLNVAVQDQTGYRNQAHAVQDLGTNSSFSMQVQRGSGSIPTGHDNFSSVLQTTRDNAWSATVQEGSNNSAAVYQH